MTMQVVNRKGEREDVRFDAIHDKLKTLTYDLDKTWIDPGHVTKLTIEGLYDGGRLHKFELLIDCSLDVETLGRRRSQLQVGLVHES